MPEPLEMPRDAGNGQREQAIDFSEFDPFREGPPKTDAPDEPENEPEDTDGDEGEGQPPPAQTTQPDDPVYEIPGAGQIRASEIKNLLASRQSLSQLQSQLQQERTELEGAYTSLQGAMYLQELLSNPKIRDGLQALVLDTFKEGADTLPASDGKADDFLRDTGLRPVHVSPEIQALLQKVEGMEAREARRDVEDLRADLAKENPDIVTAEFWASVKQQAKTLYSDPKSMETFGIRELRLVAENMLRAETAKRLQAAQKPAKPQLEKGVRLVQGNSTRKGVTQPRLKDPRKMTDNELIDEFVNTPGMTVEAED